MLMHDDRYRFPHYSGKPYYGEGGDGMMKMIRIDSGLGTLLGSRASW